jgi:hypothetical protein
VRILDTTFILVIRFPATPKAYNRHTKANITTSRRDSVNKKSLHAASLYLYRYPLWAERFTLTLFVHSHGNSFWFTREFYNLVLSMRVSIPVQTPPLRGGSLRMLLAKKGKKQTITVSPKDKK